MSKCKICVITLLLTTYLINNGKYEIMTYY